MDIDISCDSPRSSVGNYTVDSFVDDDERSLLSTPLFVRSRSCSAVPPVRAREHSGVRTGSSDLLGTPRIERNLEPRFNRPAHDAQFDTGDEFVDGCTKPPPGTTNKRPFRLACRRVLLTYSRPSPEWSFLACRELIEKLGGTYVLCRELHQDGAFHFHAYLDFGRVLQTRASTRFDVDGHHPNIRVIWTTPELVWDYVHKSCAPPVGPPLRDGELIGERTGIILYANASRPLPFDRKRSGDENWAEISAAADRDEFLEKSCRLAPRDFVLYRSAIDAHAESRYKSRRIWTPSKEIEILWDEIPTIRRWVIDSLRNKSGIITDLTDDEKERLAQPPGDRPKSLIIHGESRLWKTEVARRLGRHVYFNNDFDLDEYLADETVDFAIFDDINDGMLKGLKGYKGWMGAQAQFTTTDKYRKKYQCFWGRPCIWANNGSPLFEKGIDYRWLTDNCLIEYVGRPIARPVL